MQSGAECVATAITDSTCDFSVWADFFVFPLHERVELNPLYPAEGRIYSPPPPGEGQGVRAICSLLRRFYPNS